MRLIVLVAVVGVVACGDNTDLRPDGGIRSDARLDARPPDAPVDAEVPFVSRVWLSGDWATDGRDQAGLFADDASLPVVPAVVVPAGADELGGGNVVDLSADGGRMVYVAVDAAGVSSLYAADGDGSAPILIHAAPAGVEISFASISPDGLRIVFVADAELAGMLDLYLTAVAENATPVKLSPDRAVDDIALDVARDAAWSLTSRYLAFSGRITEAPYQELLVADTAAPGRVVTVLSRADIEVPPAAAGAKGVRGSTVFDTHNELWFRARVAASVAAPVELFHVFALGGARTPVAMPDRAGGGPAEPGAIAMSPDGLTVAYSADAPVATAYEVYGATIANPTDRTRLTDGAVVATGGPQVMWFSPDGTRLALIGDLTVPAVVEPYVLDVAGGAQTRLVALTGDRDALALQWNAGGTALYAVGDLVVDDDTALFRLDPAAAGQTPVLAVGVPVDGDVTDVDVR